ncbi:MAG: cobalt ECF transporter T component CbiQ [Acidimicrobiia bacterium]
MTGGHTHALYRHGDSVIHRLPAHVKMVAALIMVLAIVATPREALWLFAIHAAVLVTAAATARLGVRFVLTRLVIEVPFLLAALALPLLGSGERVEVLGIGLSVEGLWALFNIAAKATLGLLTSIVLAGTTEVTDLLAGFDRLRVPRVMTAIMGFMVRYVDVVAGELTRMRTAMRSRGHEAGWLGQLRPLARGVGALFVRSYERGERVYLAMASRGYAGTMPAAVTEPAPMATWVATLAIPVAAWVAVAAVWIAR